MSAARSAARRGACLRSPRLPVGVAVLGAWLLAGFGASRPAAAHTEFHVRIIAATKADKDQIDPRLRSIERELHVFKKDWNSFAVVRDVKVALEPNQSESFELPDRTPYKITMVGIAADRPGRVRYIVEMPGFKTTRVVAPGGRTLDAAPRRDKLYIVATTVHPGPPAHGPNQRAVEAGLPAE